jgi:hypothetical protein
VPKAQGNLTAAAAPGGSDSSSSSSRGSGSTDSDSDSESEGAAGKILSLEALDITVGEFAEQLTGDVLKYSGIAGWQGDNSRWQGAIKKQLAHLLHTQKLDLNTHSAAIIKQAAQLVAAAEAAGATQPAGAHAPSQAHRQRMQVQRRTFLTLEASEVPAAEELGQLREKHPGIAGRHMTAFMPDGDHAMWAEAACACAACMALNYSACSQLEYSLPAQRLELYRRPLTEVLLARLLHPGQPLPQSGKMVKRPEVVARLRSCVYRSHTLSLSDINRAKLEELQQVALQCLQVLAVAAAGGAEAGHDKQQPPEQQAQRKRHEHSSRSSMQGCVGHVPAPLYL